MPEVLNYEDKPIFFLEFHIQPFREEYIPGSVVLSIEKSSDGKVFFQIPTPTHAKLTPPQLEVLKNQIHDWWMMKGDSG